MVAPRVNDNLLWLNRACCLALLAVAAAKAIGRCRPMPPAPKVSTFAPAEDLANQADKYIKDLEEIVANEEEYKDRPGEDRQGREHADCHRLGPGLHDQESKYKARPAR